MVVTAAVRRSLRISGRLVPADVRLGQVAVTLVVSIALFLLAAVQFKATPQQARELVDRLMPTRCELSFVRIADALMMGFPGEPTAPMHEHRLGNHRPAPRGR